MLEKMKQIIAEQLNCDEGTIGLETSFKDDLGADSDGFGRGIWHRDPGRRAYRAGNRRRCCRISEEQGCGGLIHTFFFARGQKKTDRICAGRPNCYAGRGFSGKSVEFDRGLKYNK